MQPQFLGDNNKLPSRSNKSAARRFSVCWSLFLRARQHYEIQRIISGIALKTMSISAALITPPLPRFYLSPARVYFKWSWAPVRTPVHTQPRSP